MQHLPVSSLRTWAFERLGIRGRTKNLTVALILYDVCPTELSCSAWNPATKSFLTGRNTLHQMCVQDDCSRKHGLSNASSPRVCYSNHPSWIKGADLLDPPTLLRSLPPKFEAVQLSCQAEDEVHCRQRVGKPMFVATAWPKSDTHTRKDAAHAVWSCLLCTLTHFEGSLQSGN